MNILITGANGFIGKNLITWLRAAQTDGASQDAPVTLYTITRESNPEQWAQACKCTDFVFHLAGVNRENDAHAYCENVAITQKLIDCLKQQGNTCPVMFASSIHAEMGSGRNLTYGASKRSAEEILRDYSRATGAQVYIYRMPNVFGKWCRPEYNSVVATFCYRIARGQPVVNSAPDQVLQLVYVDDVMREMVCALAGEPHREGTYCVVPVTHRVTLSELEGMIRRFDVMLRDLSFPSVCRNSLEAKLLSTFVSFLPEERFCIPLNTHADERGSFTELLHKCGFGQVSVNTVKPLHVKGKHWHNSKWELFLVVGGSGRIRLRRMDTKAVWETIVSGNCLQVVLIPPGYIHALENMSQTEELVTVIWANESFDPQLPDTYYEE